MQAHQSRIGAVVNGFLTPLRLVARAWSLPLLRERYLQVAVLQSAAVLACGIIALWTSDEVELKVSVNAVVAAWSAFIGGLFFGQWLVVAFSNSYHEHFDVALRNEIHLLQDPLPQRPASVRLHMDWIRWDLKNRWLVIVTLVIGQVLLSPLFLLDEIGEALNAGALFVWGLYWLTVLIAYTTAYSHVADREPPVTRYLSWVTENVWGFRWWAPRSFVRLVKRFLAPVAGPALAVEKKPAELFGIACARLVFGVPIVWLWLRPFIAASAATFIAPDATAVATERASGSVDLRVT